jgi:mannitol-1-/sugar-/sorbitol-6-phosphatase
MSLSASPSSVMIRCQGILFDMDGVLISSISSVERSWTNWAKMRGIDPEYACHVAHGCRSIETVARLRPDLDPEIENRIVEDLEVEDIEGLTVLPGVKKLLAALPATRWTVVTSATERLTRVRLAAAGIPAPEQIITADDVTQGKPNPAPYLAGARLLGFAAEECVVFEDAASGTKSARAAGCTVVATTFSHPIDALGDANYMIADLSGVEVGTSSGDDCLVLKFTPLAV